MKTRVKNYESINQSTNAPMKTYFDNMKREYGELTKLSLFNEKGNNFYFSNKVIAEMEDEFSEIIEKCLELREAKDVSEYLTGGYIVSEINSSLKLENVHSSRKKVEAVIKNIREKKRISDETIDVLIKNYYEALEFILSRPEINARNIHSLYITVTRGMKEAEFELVEVGSPYRKGDVTIGQDVGVEFRQIEKHVENLIQWINSSEMDITPHSKAILAHYAFENIHPYYDFNGRVGRLLHLWILITKFGLSKFWELTFLSEALFSFKEKFHTMFDKILKAKNSSANIDAIYPIGAFFEILITHSEAYVTMKKIVSEFAKTPSRHVRLFIIDMICWNRDLERWFDIMDFKKIYGDYSSTLYNNILNEFVDSNVFDTKAGTPIKFRIKRDVLKKIRNEH